MLSSARNILQRLALLLVIFNATELSANADLANYALTVRGLQVGNLHFSQEIQDKEYTIKALFETTGLAGALFETKITAQTNGNIVLSRVLNPQNANIKITQRDQTRTQSMSYENGILVNLNTDPHQVTTLEPEKQSGAVDPLSALAYILRPMPLESLCKLNIRIFDGLTATRLTLNQASQRRDGRFQCQGSYTREHGFTQEQIELEGENFYFTALYRVDRETGDMMIDRIVGETSYGQFQLLRY